LGGKRGILREGGEGPKLTIHGNNIGSNKNDPVIGSQEYLTHNGRERVKGKPGIERQYIRGFV